MVDEEQIQSVSRTHTLFKEIIGVKNDKSPTFLLSFLNMVGEEPNSEHQANPTLFEFLNNLKRKRLQSFD